MHNCAIDDLVLADVVAAHGQQVSRGGVDVQPLREEHVNLVDVFFEGGVTGCVVGDVVGSAQTLTGVEGNLGGFAIGFAARGAGCLGAARSYGFAKGFVVVPD